MRPPSDWRQRLSARAPAAAPAAPEPPAAATSGLHRPQLRQVQTGLFIGNAPAANALFALRADRISHVVICAGELAAAHPQQVAYRRLPAFYDEATASLAGQLQAALPWMQDVLTQGGRLLVACTDGGSRSAAVLVAYLMWAEGRPFEQALEAVQGARPEARLPPAWARQLREGGCFVGLPVAR